MKETQQKKLVSLSLPLIPSADDQLRSQKLAAVLKKLIFSAALFTLSMFLCGVEVFPGTYPFGIAFLSAVSGPRAVFFSFIGSLIGSARIGSLRSIYIFVYVILTSARIGTSLWLDADRLTAPPKQRFSEIYQKWRESRDTGLFIVELYGAARDRFGGSLTENIRIRVALSAVSSLFAGAWSVIGGGYVYYDLLGALFSLFTVPLFAYLFCVALSRNMRASRMREISVFFVCAAVALSLHSISSSLAAQASLADAGIAVRRFTFDFGIFAAFVFTGIASVSCGTNRGILCGLLCGSFLTPIYAPAYAIGAVVCGSIAPISSTLALIVGGALSSAWGIYVGGFGGMTALFPPAVAACALLIPAYRFDLIRLPDDLFLSPSSVKRKTEASAMADIASADITRRAQSISDGLSSVAAVLEGLSEHLTKPDPNDMREIVESVFLFHCSACKIRGSCKKAHTLADKMTENLTKYGVVTADVVPRALASECFNMGRILDEINLTAAQKIAAKSDGDKLAVAAADYSLAGSLIGTAARVGGDIGKIDAQLTEKLRPLISQRDFSASSLTVYGDRFKHIFVDSVDVNSSVLGADDIRAMFEQASECRLSSPEFSLDGDDLSMTMLSRPSFSCTAGSFSRSSSDSEASDGGMTVEVEVTDSLPESVCGDVITSFESDGRFYMILSDGMGSGKEAAMTSGIAAALLERLLKSGAELEASLKMLNHIIRQTGRECSATVDIAEIDLMTGEARFIKSGAAPSFVIRDGSIFRLQSKTVPIGIIRALDAEMIRFPIKAGDTVVMVSDGAARSYDEAPWLLDLMTYDEEITKGDETAAAKKIVAEAKKRGSRDDVTAGIVRMKAV